MGGPNGTRAPSKGDLEQEQNKKSTASQAGEQVKWVEELSDNQCSLLHTHQCIAPVPNYETRAGPVEQCKVAVMPGSPGSL